MSRIAYILLCHKEPEAIVAQANRLTAAGDYISIHFDARADSQSFVAIKDALSENPNVAFARKRIKCGWGAWSLVQATLYAIEAAVDAFPKATHFYMISGDCMPTKSADYIHDFLDAQDADFIESFDYFRSDWIKTGMREERLIYRHYFNERTQKWWFYKSFGLQKQLGLKRKLPSDLRMRIGSQWWCLRRTTIEAILEFLTKRRDVLRFFKTTWIPDETFFQTLVAHLIPSKEIQTRTLTFLVFSDYGMPATFYNDHYEFLVGQDSLFARKISAGATSLRQRLGALYNSNRRDFQTASDGKNLYQFITERGRTGLRFAPRFWELESTIGRDRELFVIVCKKWHIAKRFVQQLQQRTQMPLLEYIFSEDVKELPELGGILSNQQKKARHRRALMRMLYEYYETEKLAICLDPSNIDLLRDFVSDRNTTRVLEINCDFDDQYILGHARRIGLISDQTAVETLVKLLPSIRNDLKKESEVIGDLRLEFFYRIDEKGAVHRNASELSQFADITIEQAQEIVTLDWIYSD